MIPLRRRMITTNLKTTSKITINYDIKDRNKKGTTAEKNKLNKLKDEKKAKLSFQNFSIHVAVLFMIGFIFRAYHFNFPNTITDSELVIAQQINWSLNGKFFIGSIPPVTIMIHTIIAKLLGYEGNEPILFSGQHITEFPLAQLRLVSILLNSLTIPSSYMLVRALNHNHLTAFFTAFLLTFENGTVIQSRYLSADSLTPLIYCLVVWSFFSYQNNEYLSIKKSCITGILIGIALCTKWQTILLVLSIWSISLFKGYKNICDPHTSLSTIMKNSCIQFLSLVFIPSVIYILIFQSHFYMVPRPGDHDLFLDSSIKFSLIGNEFNPTQQAVTYGSKVILKHVGTNNGYLHSHSKNYTSGSKQQQVTVYPFEDLNNIWVIRKPGSALLNATSNIEYLKNNDVIELEHITTSRKLYSHHFNPPIHHSEDYHEVTANDNSLIKENKSKWRIRIITQDENYDAQSFDPISTLTTRFRLLHHSGCYLSSHYQPLFIKDGAQQEVTCMNSAKPSVSSWVFEYAYNEYAREKTPNIQYPKPSFNQKLRYTHQLMWNYRKVVYDRLSPIKPSDNKEYDAEIRSIIWLLIPTAHLIWNDITGRSVYIIIHPIIRQFSVLLTITTPIVYIPYAIYFRHNKKMASVSYLQKTWINTSSMKTAIMMWMAILIHIFGLYMFPKHNTSLSDIIPVTIFVCIALSVIIEWLAVKYYHYRYIRKEKLFIETSPNNLHLIFVLLISLIYFIYFIKLSFIISDSSQWTKQQCNDIGLGIPNCYKYPPSNGFQDLLIPTSLKNQLSSETASLVADENHLIVETEVDIPLPGKIKLFKYKHGEEANAQHKINQIKSKAFKKASKTAYGARRFMRAKETILPV